MADSTALAVRICVCCGKHEEKPIVVNGHYYCRKHGTQPDIVAYVEQDIAHPKPWSGRILVD